MRISAETMASRREFFRGTLRYGLLALLAAVGSLTARKPTGQRCLNRGICGDCAVLVQCGLPRALSVKQKKGEPT